MENHIMTTIKHFGDRLAYAWDVKSTKLLMVTATFSSSSWYDTICPDYFLPCVL